MQALVRNKTTAEQAVALEDGNAHPFRAGLHTSRYFEILKVRRQLPVSGARQSFLNAFHQNQVAIFLPFPPNLFGASSLTLNR